MRPRLRRSVSGVLAMIAGVGVAFSAVGGAQGQDRGVRAGAGKRDAHAATSAAGRSPQAASAVADARTMRVRLHEGERELVVRGAAGRTATAAEPGAGGAGVSWTLTSRIVIRTRDARALPGQIAALGLKAEALAFTSRWPEPYFVAEAASVEAAAGLVARIAGLAGVTAAYVDAVEPRADRGVPTDPLIGSQWHLMNSVNPIADLNIEGAWNAGRTGAGVTVGVLEGGWNVDHPDLALRYDAAASQEPNGSSNHGTSVAGIVGAIGNNGLGGAGVAYGAWLSRLYYGSDTANATAFAFRNDLNAIKTNSWGPSDIGRAWVMSDLQRQSITDAATNGRGGKGTVFVWAAGNGRAANSDRVDYDPWASHPWVIAVGAVGHTDTLADYSEPGSSVMVVSPSRRTLGGGSDPGIVTTTNQEDYTNQFGGTSSSAPMAAGVIALMLEANPDLTVRDVMHALIETARRCDPANPSWYLNAAGRWTSDDYGFGAIDATAAVAAASGWTPVGELAGWSSPVRVVGLAVPDNQPAGVGGGVSSAIVMPRRLVAERVVVRLTAPHASVGQLRVTLRSPGGSESRLARLRSDTIGGRYQGYVFTSLRHWDETTNGLWTLTVSDEVSGTVGTFESWSLEVMGTGLARRSDWDRSGMVDLLDLLGYLNDWFGGIADTTGDDSVDLTDLLMFVQGWLVDLGT